MSVLYFYVDFVSDLNRYSDFIEESEGYTHLLINRGMEGHTYATTSDIEHLRQKYPNCEFEVDADDRVLKKVKMLVAKVDKLEDIPEIAKSHNCTLTIAGTQYYKYKNELVYSLYIEDETSV
ncbi:hypothetical protein WGM54_14735 [Paenibacillus polymyxa]|uniref:hypothetical protein n=1 Tax=Paenibacillus polymyxa TaxID=1406 RepID=UPI00307DE9BB